MKLSLALCAALLVSGAAIAADKNTAKPKACPKGQVATTEKATGKQVCFAPQMMMMGPAQPATGSMAKPKPKTN